MHSAVAGQTKEFPYNMVRNQLNDEVDGVRVLSGATQQCIF